MVRLLHKKTGKRIGVGLAVSIPQWCDCCSKYGGNNVNLISFQSHNGAIAAIRNLTQEIKREAVSIPQWCDCCRWQFLPTVSALRVSIPQWCDCCEWLNGSRSMQQSSFNPTMVRLLRQHRRKGNAWLNWFQSHNGAIAAHKGQFGFGNGQKFQSHNGAIAACANTSCRK